MCRYLRIINMLPNRMALTFTPRWNKTLYYYYLLLSIRFRHPIRDLMCVWENMTLDNGACYELRRIIIYYTHYCVLYNNKRILFIILKTRLNKKTTFLRSSIIINNNYYYDCSILILPIDRYVSIFNKLSSKILFYLNCCRLRISIV